MVGMLKAKPVSNSGSRVVSAVKKWFTMTATSSEAILEAKARVKSPHQKWHLTFRILKDGLWNRTAEKLPPILDWKWSLPYFSLLIMLFIITLGNTVSSLGRAYKDTGRHCPLEPFFPDVSAFDWVRFSDVYHTVSLRKLRKCSLVKHLEHR